MGSLYYMYISCIGMIPRAVRHLFNGITKRVEEAKANGLTPPNFNVTAQFLELYNEEIIDLFDSSRENVRVCHFTVIVVYNFCDM